MTLNPVLNASPSVYCTVLYCIILRAAKFLCRYQECLDPGPESNNLMDRFLHFLHFGPVLLIFCQVLSTFHEIFVCR